MASSTFSQRSCDQPGHGEVIFNWRQQHPSDGDSITDMLHTALAPRRGSSAELATLSTAYHIPKSEINVLLDRRLAASHQQGHSSQSLLLSSFYAKQSEACRAAFVQAAATADLACTETGLQLHELCLLIHLQQGSNSSQPWVLNPRASDGSALATQPDLKFAAPTEAAAVAAQAAAASSTFSFGTSAAQPQPKTTQVAAPAQPGSKSSSATDGSPDLSDWRVFAEPPDIHIEPPEMAWAALQRSISEATAGSTSSQSGSSNFILIGSSFVGKHKFVV